MMINIKGHLIGHKCLVTSLSYASDPESDEHNCTYILSASRDKSLIIWKLSQEETKEENKGKTTCAVLVRALKGHSHYVQDVTVSSDQRFCLSGSWDCTLRLWKISKCHKRAPYTKRRFVGHTGGVMSVAFSFDKRKILSGSCDKTVRLWNAVGECKFVFEGPTGHSGYVISICLGHAVIVSAGWDEHVKVWHEKDCRLKYNLREDQDHGYFNSVNLSGDGSLCVFGGKQGKVHLWDLHKGEKKQDLYAGAEINDLCFNPCRYWLCAATKQSIRIWDLEKNVLQDVELVSTGFCTCLHWLIDGSSLFAGFNDGKIRLFSLSCTAPLGETIPQ